MRGLGLRRGAMEGWGLGWRLCQGAPLGSGWTSGAGFRFDGLIRVTSHHPPSCLRLTYRTQGRCQVERLQFL